MTVNGKADPGQIAGGDWRTLAKAIGVGSYLEDAVRELTDELPANSRQLAPELKSEYGGFASPITPRRIYSPSGGKMTRFPRSRSRPSALAAPARFASI